MDAPVLKEWTRDEFFAWAEAQEERHEFEDGGPVLMVGGTMNHSLIHGNILFALRMALVGSCFVVLGPDAGMATVHDNVRYPDAVVTGTRLVGTSRLVPEPLVVFEVISPTSGKMDRVTKVREYAAVPTVRCYAIVESSIAAITVLSRPEGGGPWTVTPLGEGDRVGLEALGTGIEVAACYAGVEFGG